MGDQSPDVFAPTLSEGDAPGSRAKAERRIGEVVAGRYRLTDILGFGGMGTVFGAVHTELGKRVALKVLSSSFSGHPEATARFLREAKAASAIDSEHIAQVFDVGEDPAFGLFMVMELLKGEDLAAALHARGGKLRPEDAAAVAWQICLALERAHDAGIVHRDLKPANVFLTSVDDGSIRVKVLDFGIAKLLIDAQASQRGGDITQVGLALGTPQYMSPEQAQADQVDQRTDIYSLGAVLFEAIAGTAAYPALDTGQAVMAKVLTEDAPRLASIASDVSPDLDSLVAEMMARDPQLRPQTAAAARARLAAIFPSIGRTRLVLGGSVHPPPIEAIVPPPRYHSGGSLPGDRDATTVKGPKTAGKGPGALGAAIVAFVVVAAALFSVVRLTSLDSRVAHGPQVAPSASATLEQTIDPVELVHASQRALARGDSARARDLATVAAKRAPSVSDAWLALGAASEALGDSAAAGAAYDSCVAQAKDDGASACRAKLAH